jgi:hypothetical protein
MIQFDENFNLEAVRERLRKMDDAALLRWGQAAARLSSQTEVLACRPRPRAMSSDGDGARSNATPSDGGPYSTVVYFRWSAEKCSDGRRPGSFADAVP